MKSFLLSLSFLSLVAQAEPFQMLLGPTEILDCREVETGDELRVRVERESAEADVGSMSHRGVKRLSV